MKPIFLTGFMGSGKTSVATEVSFRLGIPSLDTDELVVKLTGLTIPEIFSEKGEGFFRQKETEALQSVPAENVVVATGGGIIGERENREWMKEIGIIVFLETSWSEIVQRLGEDPSRPLWNGKEKEDLFKNRAPVYREAADFIVSTDKKAPDMIAEEIIAKVKQ